MDRLFLDAIASHETGLLVGGLVMLFENSMKYTIIKDMVTSIDQPRTKNYCTSVAASCAAALYKSADKKRLK